MSIGVEGAPFARGEAPRWPSPGGKDGVRRCGEVVDRPPEESPDGPALVFAQVSGSRQARSVGLDGAATLQSVGVVSSPHRSTRRQFDEARPLSGLARYGLGGCAAVLTAAVVLRLRTGCAGNGEHAGVALAADVLADRLAVLIHLRFDSHGIDYRGSPRHVETRLLNSNVDNFNRTLRRNL